MNKPHDHHHDHDHHRHDHEPAAPAAKARKAAHAHSHDHSGHNHAHSHGHSHAPKDFGAAFIIGMILNTGFILGEVVFGLKANSLALLADAGHNMSDVLGLFLAWGATLLARRLPSARHTYGLRGASIIAALANAMFLLVAIGGIGWEAVQRFETPEPPAGMIVMVIAGIGIAVNGITAWLFMSGAKGDLNVRAAFLHMASDAAVSAGVVIAGGVILFTGWAWLDPVVSLVIAAVILFGTWGLLKDSVSLSLQGVPSGIKFDAVHAFLAETPGVSEVHDLHIWGMSTTETALTVHLVMPGGHPGDAFLRRIADALEHEYSIHHVTVQIEIADTDIPCELQPDTTV